MSDAPEVRPQQIWGDNDPRAVGRRIRVVEVVRNVDQPYAVVRPADDPAGRQTRIRLTRFRDVASGYRLLDNSPDPA